MEEVSAISRSSFYEDNMMLRIPVTHNSYPYRIRYEYKQTEQEFLSLARWSPYVSSSVPTNYAKLSLEVPADYPLRIHEQKTEHTETTGTAGKKQYTWEVTDIDKFETETFSPHFMDLTPFVQVAPLKFKYGQSGNLSSWESFGLWQYRLNEGRMDLPEEEKERIDKLVQGIDNDLEKIRILYHDLQDNTRYINVSIDIGGMQTYPASYVCKNGYGDCKALSNYMVAQLAYLDIPSCYALVYAGAKPPQFNRNFPSSQFNHVIVCVPMLKDTLWLECTSNNAPFGYISDFTQNRPALLIKEKNSSLVTIPALHPDNVTQNRTITLKSSRHAVPVAELKSNLKGNNFEYARYITKDIEGRDRTKYVEKFLAIPETNLISWNIEDIQRDSLSIILTASFKAEKFFSKMGNLAMVQPPAIRMPDMEDPEDRIWPVRVYTPFHRVDTLKLSIPKSADIEAIPCDTLFQTSSGKYDRKVISDEGSLMVIREFEIPIQEVPLSEYNDFYEFIHAVEKLEKEKILYKY